MIEIRTATDADVPAMLELMSAALGVGSVPRSEKYFRWKHFDSPFGASAILLAKSEGRLVGLRAFMRWTFCRGTDVRTAVRAVDTSTHPDFRGQGIFKKLTMTLVNDLTEKGTDLVFNTPNEKSGAGYRKMGWEVVGKVPVLVRPRISVARLRSHWEVTATEQESLSTLDTVTDEWLRSFQENRWGTPLDARYLRWRYQDVPNISYGSIGRPGRFLIVYRKRMQGLGREFRVCELLVSEGAWREALWAMRRASRGGDVITVSGALPAMSRLMLHAFGFASLKGPTLYSRALKGLHIRNLADWRLATGDLEVF